MKTTAVVNDVRQIFNGMVIPHANINVFIVFEQFAFANAAEQGAANQKKVIWRWSK